MLLFKDDAAINLKDCRKIIRDQNTIYIQFILPFFENFYGGYETHTLTFLTEDNAVTAMAVILKNFHDDCVVTLEEHTPVDPHASELSVNIKSSHYETACDL